MKSTVRTAVKQIANGMEWVSRGKPFIQIPNDPASGLAGGYSESAKQFSLASSTMSWYVDDRGIVVVHA